MSKKNIIEQFDESVIEIDGVYPKSNIIYYLSFAPDKSGKLPNCIKRIDDKGNMIMSEKERDAYSEGTAIFFPEDHIFEVKVGRKYNLNDLYDKAEWEAIKNSPYIAPSRDARDKNGNLIIDGVVSTPEKPTRNGVAELFIKHPGLDTHRKVAKIQKINQAQNAILNDEKGADGQRLMARLLGRNMSNQPIADVLDYLLDVASKSPDKILSLYSGSDTSLRLLLIEARDKHVIYVKNKVYIYGDNIVLGTTDDQALAWMKNPKNNKVLELIRKDTYPELYSTD